MKDLNYIPVVSIPNEQSTHPTVPSNLEIVSIEPNFTVTVSFTESTDAVYVKGYVAYIDGMDIEWVGSFVTAPPMVLNWIPPGAHTLRVAAVNFAALYSEKTQPVEITMPGAVPENSINKRTSTTYAIDFTQSASDEFFPSIAAIYAFVKNSIATSISTLNLGNSTSVNNTTGYNRSLYAWAIADANKKLAVWVDRTGTFCLPVIGSVKSAIQSLQTAITSLQSLSNTTGYNRSLYAWAIADVNKKVALGLDRAGNLISKGVVVDISTLQTDVNTLKPLVIGNKSITCWGDSLTAGAGSSTGGYPAALAALTGLPVTNKGVGSDTSTQVAFRMGAISPLLQITGNQIPASGSVIVDRVVASTIDISAISIMQIGWSIAGELASIPGTFSVAADTVQTADSLSWSGGIVTATKAAGHGYQAGINVALTVASTPLNVSALTNGNTYTIYFLGNTTTAQWTAIGVTGTPAVGSIFTYNGATGVGTGTVTDNAVTYTGANICTIISATQFTYPLASNPGTISGTFTFFKTHGVATFTRTTAGSVFNVDPKDPYIYFNPTSVNSSDITIVMIGQNDIGNSIRNANILSNLSAIVQNLKASNKKYLIMPVFGANAGSYGSSGYNSLITLNNTIRDTYPKNYINTRSRLITNYNASLSQDVIDYNNDIIPSSLRYDAVHLNDAGYSIVGSVLFNKLTTLGWL